MRDRLLEFSCSILCRTADSAGRLPRMDARQDAESADRLLKNFEAAGLYGLLRPIDGHDLPTRVQNLPTPGLIVRVLAQDRHWLPQAADSRMPALSFEAAESPFLRLNVSHVPSSIG